MAPNGLFRNIGRMLIACAVASSAWAARTDIATTPLTTSSSSSVQPNLMFILDDSGSMNWEHLPDDARDAGSTVTFRYGFYGLRSSQCNEIYYDPAVTYLPPVDSLGNNYPNASFTAAVRDGYRAATSASGSNPPINLDTSFRAAYDDDSGIAGDATGSAAYYYSYSGSQLSSVQRDYNSTSNTFYSECNSASGSSPGSTVFTKVTVSGATQQQNFANWYSYYRSRMLMMKTSAGLAFKSVDNAYRVGFMTINNNNGNGKDFLNITTFDSAQKASWYAKLYSAESGGSTPLRKALSVAGRIYGGTVSSLYSNTVTDPLQYSCQQNFTILSSDGFWNGTKGTKLDNATDVGNQDGGQPRPYSDGFTTTYSMTTSQLQRTQTQMVASTNQIQSRTHQLQRQTLQVQKRTTQILRRTEQLRVSTAVTTNAATTILIGNVGSGDSVSAININGADRLPGTITASGANGAARRNSIASEIAANLSGGYEIVAFGACSGNNTPFTGCSNSEHYVRIMAPPGSGNFTGGVVFGTSGSPTITAANFSGGTATTAATGPTNAATCNAGVSYANNTRTVTTCSTTDTGFVSASSCNPSSSGGQTITCDLSDTGFVNASTCSASSGAGQAITCDIDDSGFADVSACSPSGPTGGLTVNCNTSDTGWVGAGSCTPSASASRTVACQTVSAGPTAVASCSNQTAAAGNNWVQRVCATNTISPATGVASCTPATASAANSFVATLCNTVNTPATTVSLCTAATASAANNWTSTSCGSPVNSGGTSDTLADIAQYYYGTDLRTSNCTGTPVSPATTGNDVCTNNVPQSGADTAPWQHMTTFTLGLGARGRMIFSPTYLSDTSGDYFAVKNGSVATSTVCTWQNIGTICNWPIPGINSSGSDGKVENIDDLWHAAVNGRGSYFSATNPTTLASGLTSALAGVTIRTGGTAAATTSSPNIVAGDNFVFSSNFTSGEWSGELFRFTLNPVTLAFSATNDWRAQALLDAKPYASRTIYTYDPSNASTRLKSFDWASLTTAERGLFGSTQAANLSQLCTTGTGCLPVWQAAHLYSVNDEYRNGTTWYRVTTAYTSGSTFGATDTSNAVVITGPIDANLVNFLRGDRTNEGNLSDPSKYFRQRAHILGDIVNSEAVYVKAPHYRYLDTDYAAYVTAQAGRQGMVYVAANDGMLHAFKSGGAVLAAGDNAGEELWAYIPSLVMPNLYKLADKSYSSQHQYYVDGTPTQADVYYNGAWHTILVGGLNGGGRGYYALDVTDPAAPKALWEFTYDTSKGAGYTTDANLGYTFGKPVITKLKNGTWVVLVTSGYNNGDGGTSPGDGKGYLYVLDAQTGAKIGTPLGTGVGSATAAVAGCSAAPCPSGLAQIAQWADFPALDNTAKRVYGGDMFGNLWRFDIDDNIAPAGKEATLLATLRGPATTAYPGGNFQPITARPVLGNANGNAMVYIGTGRLLGVSDLVDDSLQSLYGVKDALGATGYGNPRDDARFIQQTIAAVTCPTGSSGTICAGGQLVRTGTNLPVDLGTDKGWFIDLPDRGERANVDPALALGTLAFNTNIPTANACTAGGYSYTYFFNYLTGAPVSASSNGVVGIKLGNGLTSRPVLVESTTGKVVSINQVDGAGGVTSPNGTTVYRPTQATPQINVGSSGVKRVSWRELVD